MPVYLELNWYAWNALLENALEDEQPHWANPRFIEAIVMNLQ
jgi:hypothetical protein